MLDVDRVLLSESRQYRLSNLSRLVVKVLSSRVPVSTEYPFRPPGRCDALMSVTGGIKPGCFKIGNTGGMMDNLLLSKLYRPGRSAAVCLCRPGCHPVHTGILVWKYAAV